MPPRAPVDPALPEPNAESARQKKLTYGRSVMTDARKGVKINLDGAANFDQWLFQETRSHLYYDKCMTVFDPQHVSDPSLFCDWAVQTFGENPMKWFQSAVATDPELNFDWDKLLATLKGMYVDPTRPVVQFSELRSLLMAQLNLTLAKYNERFNVLVPILDEFGVNEKFKTFLYVDGLRPDLGNMVREHFSTTNLHFGCGQGESAFSGHGVPPRPSSNKAASSARSNGTLTA